MYLKNTIVLSYILVFNHYAQLVSKAVVPERIEWWLVLQMLPLETSGLLLGTSLSVFVLEKVSNYSSVYC